jgi:hypothetical protein
MSGLIIPASLHEELMTLAALVRRDMAERREAYRFGAFVRQHIRFDARGRGHAPQQCCLCRAWVPFGDPHPCVDIPPGW